MPLMNPQKDKLSTEERSILMGKVRSKNTKPEIAVRKLIHAKGYRFRLHRRDIPGSPDLVFPSLKKVIFVHGCFWHRHTGCKMATTPNTRREFWNQKFASNIKRDQRNFEELAKMGWKFLIIWECEIKDFSSLTSKAMGFLEV